MRVYLKFGVSLHIPGTAQMACVGRVISCAVPGTLYPKMKYTHPRNHQPQGHQDAEEHRGLFVILVILCVSVSF